MTFCQVYPKKFSKMFNKISSINHLAEYTQIKLNDFHWHSIFIFHNFSRKYVHLPHSLSMKQWAASVDTSPGSSCDLFEDLGTDAMHCWLMAWSIRKQIIFNTTQEKYVAFVDYGNAILQHLENIASEASLFISWS